MQRATHFDINSQVRPPANMLILMSPILRYGQNFHGKVLGMAVNKLKHGALTIYNFAKSAARSKQLR